MLEFYMFLKQSLVSVWLIVVLIFVVLMVFVGGLTRLMDAGLSMVEWRLIIDTVPPFSHAAWMDVFETYLQFPEYQLLNQGMTLSDFKRIYFWEYSHRLIARLLGLVFFIPFLFFLLTKKLSRSVIYTLVVAMFLGFLQVFSLYLLRISLDIHSV